MYLDWVILSLISKCSCRVCNEGQSIILDVAFSKEKTKKKSIRRSANLVAHLLAKYARNVVDEVIWIEYSPSPTLEALYFDSLHIQSS